jgi:hypothetical protein
MMKTADRPSTTVGLLDPVPDISRRQRPNPLVAAAAGALALVICVVAAVVFGLVAPPVFAAEADLIFEPNVEMSSYAAERDMATHQLIVRNRAVLEPVALAARMPLEDLERMVSVEVVGQSNILRITVANPSRDTALTLARLITAEYQRRFSAGSLEAVDPAITRLEGQVETTQKTLAQILDRLEALARERVAGQPPSAEERELRETSTSTLQRMNALQDQINALELRRLSRPMVSSLTPPHLLKDPLGPGLVQLAATGALVGLLLGAGIALVLLRPRFHSDS